VTGVDHKEGIRGPPEPGLRQPARDQHPGRVIRAEGIPDPKNCDPWWLIWPG
jgi:hypothetical protein